MRHRAPGPRGRPPSIPPSRLRGLLTVCCRSRRDPMLLPTTAAGRPAQARQAEETPSSPRPRTHGPCSRSGATAKWCLGDPSPHTGGRTGGGQGARGRRRNEMAAAWGRASRLRHGTSRLRHGYGTAMSQSRHSLVTVMTRSCHGYGMLMSRS